MIYILPSRKRNALAALFALQHIDSFDIKAKKGKTRQWIKRRETHGYYQNIIMEFSVEDLASFVVELRVRALNFV